MENNKKSEEEIIEFTKDDMISDQNENEKNSSESNNTPEKKEKKKKRKIILIILIIFLSVILILAAAAAIFIGDKLGKIQIDSNESTTIAPNQEFVSDEVIDFGKIDDVMGKNLEEILKKWATNDGQKIKKSHIINILLIGSDASAKQPGRVSVTDKGNTDVMMIVSIDKINKTIKMASIMRDSYIYMDQFNKYAKLNAACSNGGPAYLVETIENNYKIEIDGYVMVDFDSFTHVIDILGGVNVDVPSYVANHLGSNFPRGNNVLLNGEQALLFSRVRYTDSDGDISRVARQRQVINAIINKCKNASLGEINAVLDVILANVRTNVSQKSIINYATKAVTDGWANFTIQEETFPDKYTRYGYTYKSHWVWIVDYPLAAQTMQLYLYGETNIELPEDRVTAIDEVGGYVAKKESN